MITEILIEKQPLTLSKDVEVLLTKSIDDVKDFSSRNTTFSKTIVLPGDANNNKLFGHIFDVSVFNDYNAAESNVGINFNAAKAAECMIYSDGIQVFKGVLRIMQVTMVKGVVEYEAAVFGELGGFIAAIGDSMIDTLDFSDYDHQWSISNITASWGTTPGSGYYYPLIDYGYTTDGIAYPVQSIRPAIYVKEVMDKIMQESGYTYESTFLEGDFFKKLIIPHNLKEVSKTSSQLVTARNTSTTTLLNVIDDGSALFKFPTYTLSNFTQSGTTYFTYTGVSAAANVQLNVEGDINLSFSGGGTHTITFTIKLYKSGYILATKVFTQTTSASSATFRYAWALAQTLTINPSDQFYVEGSYVMSVGYPGTLDFGSITEKNCSLLISANTSQVAVANYNDTIDMASNLPKNITRKSFFTSIVNMFNLYVTESEERTRHLIITPYIEYYNTNLDQALDYTYKLDHSRPMVIKPMGEVNHRSYQFKYKEDVDYYNDLYKKKFNETYGSVIYDTGLEFSKDKKTVEVIFAATPLTEYLGIDRVHGAIYKQTNTTKEPFSSVIRILIRSAENLSTTSWTIKDGTTTLGTYTTYPYAGHLDDIDTPVLDINFGAPRELYYTPVGSYPSSGLFNLYWSAYVAEITSKDSKLLSASFKLSPVDILELDFSKFIFINDQLFRLNKVIDYDAAGNEVTKCELINVISMA